MDTRLILHVEGTQADTQELSRSDVMTAVAEGRLSQSQLVWSEQENTWKQLCELPDFAPEESLILHVKGTESDTRELPKQAVREAIARGDLSHSQLIWSATDSAWKQVSELPDLHPGETMILHVKGTESETRELLKPAIRAAISRGEITHSQLIWSPLDSTWKPVSQMPDLAQGESLILHVKGTESDTKEMPKTAIRTAISKGQITHSQLIWSPAESQWRQVRDVPELLPSQKLAPAPAQKAPVAMADGAAVARPASNDGSTPAATAVPRARPATEGPPRINLSSAGSSTPTPRVIAPQPALSSGAVPGVALPRAHVPSAQVRAAVAAGPQAAPSARPVVARAVPSAAAGPHLGHVVEEQEDGFHPIKWLCIGLAILVFIVLSANHILVERRLANEFSQTKFSDVFVYAHYAAFVQPNVIVIHVPATSKLTPDNLTDFLVALAKSTPTNPVNNEVFDRVALTSGWAAQYSFPGESWKKLGEMGADSIEDRKSRILEDGVDAKGEPLMPPSTLNDAAQEAQRERTWREFVAHFTKS